MTNIQKPELERGNYIAYADEPNTIVDNSGGGGVQVLNAHYDFDIEANVLDTVITFNELKSAFEAGSTVHLEILQKADQYTLIEVGRMLYIQYKTGDSISYKVVFAYNSTFAELRAESPDSPMTM